jgi:hypothetical protein
MTRRPGLLTLGLAAIAGASSTEGFLDATYCAEDMAEDKVNAALSLLERLAISLEGGVIRASIAG